MKKRIALVLCGLMIGSLITGCNSEKEEIKQITVESLEEAEMKEESATEQAETEAKEESVAEQAETINTVRPLPATLNMDNLDNCTVAVSLEEGDAYVDDTGVMQMKVTVYDYDVYDMVDVSLLKEGDTIEIRNQEIQITSIEQNDYGTIIINDGIDNGGYELSTNDNGVYYECGYSDIKSYYEIGQATLEVSQDFKYTDASDLENGEVVYYPGDFLTDDAGIEYFFNQNNTTITIEGGKVIAMKRIYMP